MCVVRTYKGILQRQEKNVKQTKDTQTQRNGLMHSQMNNIRDLKDQSCKLVRQPIENIFLFFRVFFLPLTHGQLVLNCFVRIWFSFISNVR